MRQFRKLIPFGARTSGFRRCELPFAIGLIAGVLSISGCSGVVTQNPGVNVQVTAHSATLSWNPSSSVVVGYRVYRSTQSGAAYTLLTSTLVSASSFKDSTVVKGQTYYYVVTAVDDQSRESGFSNEVLAIIPSA
jgi:fibronectin type 3 domain-containing protein